MIFVLPKIEKASSRSSEEALPRRTSPPQDSLGPSQSDCIIGSARPVIYRTSCVTPLMAPARPATHRRAASHSFNSLADESPRRCFYRIVWRSLWVARWIQLYTFRLGLVVGAGAASRLRAGVSL